MAITIISLIAQIIMKTSVEPNYKLLLNLQIQECITIMLVTLPFEAQLYVDIVRSIVDFEML